LVLLVEGVAIIYHLGGRSPEPSDKIGAARAKWCGERNADEPAGGLAGRCHSGPWFDLAWVCRGA